MKNHQLTQNQNRAYAHHLHMEEKSIATMEKYLRDIWAFACWLDGRNISKELTTEWKSHLVTQDYAPTTVISAIKSRVNSLLETAFNEAEEPEYSGIVYLNQREKCIPSYTFIVCQNNAVKLVRPRQVKFAKRVPVI